MSETSAGKERLVGIVGIIVWCGGMGGKGVGKIRKIVLFFMFATRHKFITGIRPLWRLSIWLLSILRLEMILIDLAR